MLLKLVEEEETEKVCKELNITTTNYWVIIHRAKLQLRACLKKTGLERKKMKKLMKLIMLSCRKATFLIEKSHDTRLSFIVKFDKTKTSAEDIAAAINKTEFKVTRHELIK